MTRHLPELLVGLRWLFDTAQPRAAMVSAGGQVVRSGRRSLRFRPVDWQGHAVIEIVGPAAAGDPSPRAELEAYVQALDDMGEDVVASWIGRRGQVRSIALARPVHPTLRAAVDRYVAGCVEHPGRQCACGRRARDCSVSLRAVERAVGRHKVEFDALSGPWPDALDPSGELGLIAAGVVPQLADQTAAGNAV
ncbi:hypothetical protein [Mycolicibacterium sp. CBMA 226]|uniref:hypothetical protein n=1 Tax=Mycolicibacterium sp. CBMA 226 TaxID=2606611 RepID=UPI0012DDF0EB|nr:hypothetical protein [Mycolicibacterium sp. CBMA 226]MUL76201.1 hypothetical protein [Mycolicibacterium sp. CBMA 226]